MDESLSTGILFLKKRVASGELGTIASELACFKDSGCIEVDRLRSEGDGVLVPMDCVPTSG